jgi:hypothetical protein
MADETRRLSPSVLQTDRDALAALKNIGNYTPVNPDCTVTKLQDKQDAMGAQQEIETQKQAELDAARDNTVATEWAFHNAMLTAKDQVKAQFGADSNEWQALGLTKKSEKAKPTKKPAPTPGK